MKDVNQVKDAIFEYYNIVAEIEKILKKYFHWNGGIRYIEVGVGDNIYAFNYDDDCYNIPIAWLFMSEAEREVAINKYKENIKIQEEARKKKAEELARERAEKAEREELARLVEKYGTTPAKEGDK